MVDAGDQGEAQKLLNQAKLLKYHPKVKLN